MVSLRSLLSNDIASLMMFEMKLRIISFHFYLMTSDDYYCLFALNEVSFFPKLIGCGLTFDLYFISSEACK